MVSIAIMIIVTSLILANYRGFDSSLVVNSLAYDVGLSIREAQTYGVSVRGNGSTDLQDYSYPYGISFSGIPASSYTLFVDLSKDDPTEEAGVFDGSAGETVENLSLQQSYIIKDICTVSGSVPSCGKLRADITFLRPNPDAIIYVDGTKLTADAVIIQVGTNRDTTSNRYVYVYPTGQISIKTK